MTVAMTLRRALVLPALLAMPAMMPALAAGAPKAPAVLHLKYRLMARGANGLSVSGAYVGFTQTTSTRQRTSERFVLLNDRTGKRIRTPANCDAGVVGVPWVALYCANPSPSSQLFQLYNVRTQKRQQLACNARCRSVYYYTNLLAVGARWVAVQVEPHQPCGDGIHNSCGPATNIYYDIATGKPRSPRTGSRTIIDLNSPRLTRRVCQPLQLPAGSNSTFFPPPLTFYGSFALAREQNGVYLERCGSHLHKLLSVNPSGSLGNTHAVAFCPQFSQQWSGIFLPSLRPFRFTVPRVPFGPDCGLTVLGARHIYTTNTVDLQQRLWVAAFPSKPAGSGSH